MRPVESMDEGHMRRALALAERGLFTTDPNPRVGCVIASGASVVAEGWHERAGEPHAEVQALRRAGGAAAGTTVYVTLEPCSHVGRTPPCTEALIAAGVARVVCASIDPNPQVAGAGVRRLREAGVEVSVGVLAPEARELNAGFFARHERGCPYVRLKMAMSLDGRTGFAQSRVVISGDASRMDVQALRARSSAVLTGSGTVMVDDPQLTVRMKYGSWVRQPLRVVLDTNLRCNPQAHVFENGGALVYTSSGLPDFAPGVQVERVAAAAGGLDLQAVLRSLAQREVNEVLLECGPRLAAGFLSAGLVDEIVLYLAPVFLGSDALPLVNAPASSLAGQHGNYAFSEVVRLGEDVRFTLRRTG